jgi:hypothetical protein
MAQKRNDMLFYFSPIIYQDSPYHNHKKHVELNIKSNAENYTIVRLGNVWECTNKHTFLNYIKAHPEAEVRENEIKYMISAQQLNMVLQGLPLTGKNEISIFGEMLTVKECLAR